MATVAPARRAHAWLVALLLAGFALRAWAISFRLPYVSHPDEPRNLEVALRVVQSSDLNPHFFRYPSLSFYANSVVLEAYYWVGRLTHALHARSDLLGPIVTANGCGFTRMPELFVLGRATSLISSLVTAALVSSTARLLSKRVEVGLLAAALVLAAPTSVEHSRYLTPDTLATCFVALTGYFAARVFVFDSASDRVLAAVAAGLAASTKYNAALALLSVAAALLLRHGARGAFRPWFYAVPLIALLTFALTTPYALLAHKQFVHDLTYEAKHYATGHEGMEGNTWAWYAGWVVREQGAALIFTLSALALMLRQRRRELWLVAAFPIAYLLFIGRLPVRNDRTALLLVPGLSILAAWGVADAVAWLGARWSWPERPARRALLGGVCALVLAEPAWSSVVQTRASFAPDSRDTARVWIQKNIPAHARIALEAYAPWVDPERYRVDALDSHSERPPAWYRHHHVEFVIFAQTAFLRYFAEPERYAKQVERYRELFEAFEPVAVFTDGGYEVRIHRVIGESEPKPRSHLRHRRRHRPRRPR